MRPVLYYIKERSIWIALLSALCVIKNPLHSQVYLEQNYDWEKPPKPHKSEEEFLQDAHRITIKDAIYNVLETTIAGQKLKLDWLTTQIDFEQARRNFYIPTMTVNSGINFSYSLEPTPGTLANPSDETVTITPSAGFSTSYTLLDGTALSFDAKVSGTHKNGGVANDSNTAAYSFSVSRPLLKGNVGRWLDLHDVYLGFEQSYWSHVQNLEGIVLGATRDYWALVGQIKRMQIQQDQTFRTAQTVESTKVMIANGQALPSVLNDAIVALAKQRISLTQAEQGVYDSYMNFINGQNEINLCTDFMWDLILDDYYQTEDVDIAEYQAQMWNFIIESLDRRIDIQTALIAEERAEISLFQAYNKYLPSLDLKGSISNTGGFKGAASRPFTSALDLPPDENVTTNITAGITFSMPLLDFAGRVAVIKAKINLKKARLTRQQVVMDAINQLSITMTDILSLLRQLKQQKFIITDTRDVLNNKTFLLRQGMLTIQEYLGYQGQYVSVLLQQNQNYVNLSNLLVRLRQQTNTLIYIEDDCTIHIADIYTLPFGEKSRDINVAE